MELSIVVMCLSLFLNRMEKKSLVKVLRISSEDGLVGNVFFLSLPLSQSFILFQKGIVCGCGAQDKKNWIMGWRPAALDPCPNS